MLAGPNEDALEHLQPGSVDWPKVGTCNFRYFERVPGFVELKVISKDNLETIESGEMFVGACVCKL
jgi:hypothetical protein